MKLNYLNHLLTVRYGLYDSVTNFWGGLISNRDMMIIEWFFEERLTTPNSSPILNAIRDDLKQDDVIPEPTFGV